jgi:hypothetical protein
LQNVSVNTLLNQILLAYSSYDRPMKRFQMIKLPAPTFNYVLQAATNEAAAKAGRLAGKDVPKTYIRAKWGILNAENSLEYLRAMSAHAKLFDYSEVIHDGTLSITLSHNFGAKGSLFLQNYVEEVFSQSGKVPKFSHDENAVVFELQ